MTEEEKREIIQKYKIDTAICHICGKPDDISKLEYVKKGDGLVFFHKECLKNW
jgi:hypothetical protein